MIKSKDHHFNTNHAKAYGIVEAILIHNLVHWIENNLANKRNIHCVTDGDLKGQSRCWSYNSISAYSKIFDYISPKKIRTALDGLVESNILIKGYFNLNKSDRSNWYAFYCEEDFIEDRFLSNNKATHLPHRANAFAPQGESIYTDTIQTNKKHNIPLEEKVELFSLLTSNQPMYESKKQNIDANCTIPVNDITIPVLKDKPKKVKSNFQSNPEKYIWINAKFKEWNDNSPTDIQIKKPSKSDGGSFHVLGVVYEKFGEEKATAFFDYIMSKGNYRNPFSLSSLKNHEEFNNFYQDPEEEQPKYLDTNKGKETARFKTSQTEPVAGDFFQGDNFYAAMENYWSQSLNGTSLVKKVRERIIQINSKYKNY